jgi:hypothetical protein
MTESAWVAWVTVDSATDLPINVYNLTQKISGFFNYQQLFINMMLVFNCRYRQFVDNKKGRPTWAAQLGELLIRLTRIVSPKHLYIRQKLGKH